MIKNIDTDFYLNLAKSKKAFESHDIDLYRKYLSAASLNIRDMIESGHINLALNSEASLSQYIKLQENEENYFLAYLGHKNIFWNSGQQNSPGEVKAGKEKNIVFVVQNGVLLGHSQVMLSIIKEWKSLLPDLNIFCFTLSNAFEEKLATQLIDSNVKIMAPPKQLEAQDRIKWLRDEIEKNEINTAIWLSLPLWVTYIFGFKIARRQIMWSLKFHPIHLGDTVCHIGMTKENEGIIMINDSPWKAFQPPLQIKITHNYDKNKIESNKIKASFKGKLIFGTLARTEKFNSIQFVDALIEILDHCSDSVYLYSGMQPSLFLLERAKLKGVDKKIFYIGWADTELFSLAFDVFLETFPFGCGITGMQALTNGTALVSLWYKDTLPRYQLKSFNERNKYLPPWFVAENVSEYIAMSKSLYVSFKKKGKLDKHFNKEISLIDKNKAEVFYNLVMEKI